MPFAQKQITEPGAPPISIEEAKLFLRVDSDNTAEDDLILDIINAAALYVRHECKTELVKCNWRMSGPAFVDPTEQTRLVRQFALPIQELLPNDLWRQAIPVLPSPLYSVTTIKYRGTDGTYTTIDPSQYQVISDIDPGYVAPVPSASWPTPAPGWGDAVVIEHVAGFGDPIDIPAMLRQAIKVLVNHMYVNRLPVLSGVQSYDVPDTVKNLIEHWRLPELH